MSLPVRERGLKLLDGIVRPYDCAVAPRAGAWIEIRLMILVYPDIPVAPRAGAWIEIYGHWNPTH